MSLNSYQKEKLDEETLEETLFDNLLKNHSKFIKSLGIIEEPEIRDLAGLGIHIYPVEEHFPAEILYSLGSNSRHYFKRF